MRIVSLNIGRPQIMVRGDRRVSSAINRRPASGPVEAAPDGLAGDRVSDDRVHGGPDKAICVYPSEHYATFSQLIGRTLATPAFGENLTTAGLLESEVCVGDRFEIGGVLVEVTQPRQPCLKLALKHEAPLLPRWINERGFTGFYLRVLRNGALAAGDAIRLVERPFTGLTIAHLTRVALDPAAPRAEVERIVSVGPLAGAWRARFERRLRGDDESSE
jgi:MOSC domain-containing protein YiiM